MPFKATLPGSIIQRVTRQNLHGPRAPCKGINAKMDPVTPYLLLQPSQERYGLLVKGDFLVI